MSLATLYHRQIAGVLGGDSDAVRHHPDLNGHPVGKSCLRYPLPAQKYRIMHGPAVGLAAGGGVLQLRTVLTYNRV